MLCQRKHGSGTTHCTAGQAIRVRALNAVIALALAEDT